MNPIRSLSNNGPGSRQALRALTGPWAAAGLLLCGLLLPANSQAEEPAADTCLTCHEQEKADALKLSVHGSLDCVSCHSTATTTHEGKLPPVDCSECHGDVPGALSGGVHATKDKAKPGPTCTACHGNHGIKPAAAYDVKSCATCHSAAVTDYQSSIHGKGRQNGDKDVAVCSSCHGAAHGVLKHSDPRSPVYALTLPKTCAKCHADAELVKKHKIPGGNIGALFMDSIHGRALADSGLLVAANCSSCHGNHAIHAPTDPRSKVFKKNIPKTCGVCHAGIEQRYAKSEHGKALAAGNLKAPVCIDCHTAHDIRRVDSDNWQLSSVGTCGGCHPVADRTYRETFHGKVTSLGSAEVARCSSCHEAHSIVSPRSPESSLSKANIVKTCEKCHPGATASFAQFQPHADHTDSKRSPFLYYAHIFMKLLLLGTMSFFGLHTLLWFPRSLAERRRRARAVDEGRSS